MEKQLRRAVPVAGIVAEEEPLEARMTEAVALAVLHGQSVLDDALGTAAVAGRFADGDLESIIVHASGSVRSVLTPPPEHSLAAGTSVWSELGTAVEEDDQ